MGLKGLRCSPYLSPVVLYLGILNSVKLPKCIRRLSDKSEVKLIHLYISVMYDLDFSVSLHSPPSHKLNEIFLFCCC